ncbi:MAG TPA: NFACT RNA binding domain-containing protein [Thermomicrobiaceae bacterium]|nr:NFACT RNA binding domain-containing protein [Thermomicrobiaceae bacterium]
MLDALGLAALADELSRLLLDGYIQKVVQLDEQSVGLEIYANHQRHFLVASADSRNPRLYLSSARVAADPDRVSPLLLLLRKYARGGRIVAFQQPALERILEVSIAKRFWPDKNDDAPDEAAELVYVTLIVELMGRRSNIILTDENGRILDAVKRVTPEMSRVRPILPGRQYTPPPPQAKRDPRGLAPAELGALRAAAAPGARAADLLVHALAGISPQMAREVVYRAAGAEDAAAEAVDAVQLAGALAELLAPLESGAWQPSLYLEDGEPVAFAPLRLASLASRYDEEATPTLSAAVERASSAGAEPAHLRYARRREKLVAQIGVAVDRVRARLHSLREEAERASAAERWREQGELIYAYLYQLSPGQTELAVEDRRIPLDPSMTPSENAQEYFERYRKGRSAQANLPELIQAATTELAYLDELRTLAELADGLDEIEQLRGEWEEWAAPHARQPARGTAQGKRPPRPKRPQPYRSERGDLIYVGHNGRQNEIVTFELAAPDDTWLHARGMPGAHVVVHWSGAERPELLEQAASLAAWYSAGRAATSVEVDAAPRRYVRKLKGAGPGMVTYRHERTINARPRGPEELGLA